VHGIHEAHLPVIERQNHRGGADPFAKETYAFQQVSIRNARTRKNHLLPGRQVFRIVNPFGIFHSHLRQPLLVLRLADYQPRQDLPIQTAQRRCG
jgi:hypothetical protein